MDENIHKYEIGFSSKNTENKMIYLHWCATFENLVEPAEVEIINFNKVRIDLVWRNNFSELLLHLFTSIMCQVSDLYTSILMPMLSVFEA